MVEGSEEVRKQGREGVRELMIMINDETSDQVIGWTSERTVG